MEEEDIGAASKAYFGAELDAYFPATGAKLWGIFRAGMRAYLSAIGP